jgi:hypothetical protein
MERSAAPARTREELRALTTGDLGTAAERGDLVHLALRLIVEEPLEGEVSDGLAGGVMNVARARERATGMAIGRAR